MRKVVFMLTVFLLIGCEPRNTFAPVTEGRWHASKNFQGMHAVRKGETLYAIAFHYDLDYRKLAAMNHLASPYTLKVGQVLRINHFLAMRPKAVKQMPALKKHPAFKPAKHWFSGLPRFNNHWTWPLYGRMITRFSPEKGKKGIDIAGKRGEKIKAALDGVVAYSGNGLSGYGNLIIIKHNNQFLTAYGNNLRNFVREGQRVKVGQVIAEIGRMDRQFWGVHFEIRRNGKPVNPLNYLRG